MTNLIDFLYGKTREFAGSIQVNLNALIKGKLQVDDTTEATTTTDGAGYIKGGLSVAKNAVVGAYNIARAFYSQKDIDMTDDGVSSILLSNSITGLTIGTMFMDIAIRDTYGGTTARFARIAFYLVAGSTAYAVVISDNGNLGSGVKVLTDDVTGTTGDDGYLTVACYTGTSPNSWSIKLENRLGSTVKASIMFSCINN